MYGGRIAEFGSVTDIFERTVHPYTKALIAAFPDVTGQKALSDGIRGEPPNMLAPPSGCLFHPRCNMAKGVCRESAPEQREISEGHFISCHIPEVRS
jgi:oligopeptide/dipeptide ABC transporter ATP-binding protein